jgi:hypothetical protein
MLGACTCVTQTSNRTEHNQMKLTQHCSFSIGSTIYVFLRNGFNQIYRAKISTSTTIDSWNNLIKSDQYDFMLSNTFLKFSIQVVRTWSKLNGGLLQTPTKQIYIFLFRQLDALNFESWMSRVKDNVLVEMKIS